MKRYIKLVAVALICVIGLSACDGGYVSENISYQNEYSKLNHVKENCYDGVVYISARNGQSYSLSVKFDVSGNVVLCK